MAGLLAVEHYYAYQSRIECVKIYLLGWAPMRPTNMRNIGSICWCFVTQLWVLKCYSILPAQACCKHPPSV